RRSPSPAPARRPAAAGSRAARGARWRPAPCSDRPWAIFNQTVEYLSRAFWWGAEDGGREDCSALGASVVVCSVRSHTRARVSRVRGVEAHLIQGRATPDEELSMTTFRFPQRSRRLATIRWWILTGILTLRSVAGCGPSGGASGTGTGGGAQAGAQGNGGSGPPGAGGAEAASGAGGSAG